MPQLTPEDIEDYQKCYSTWSKFIDYVTNGKMSKPNYTLEAMKEVFDERLEEEFVTKDIVREKIEKAKMISNSNQVSLSPRAHNQLLDIILEELEIIASTGRKKITPPH